jgi:dTDP-4-amino-4,6-dideoxygalactose transaminase
MNIKLVGLQRQYQPLKGEILAEIERVLDDMHLFLGKNVCAFEGEFADYCGARHAIGVGSGTDALHLALWALDIGPGDEVITVSHTFMATAEAIAMVGATPVFVDVDPHHYTMAVDQVEAAITPRTRAILPVHLYGQAADMDPLLDIAQRHNLPVIEDASQAQGCEYKGRRVGTLGTIGCFSLYLSKNLGAYGEAGIITTNDDDLCERLRMIRDHGSRAKNHHLLMGTNARLDELQAAVLRVKLRHLDAWNEARRRNAHLYAEALRGTGVQTPVERGDGKHVYYVYVVRTPDRDGLRDYLNGAGIGAAVHYPIPVHLQPACTRYGVAAGALPHTERLVGEILSLPMYPELRGDEITHIADRVRAYRRAGSAAAPDRRRALSRAGQEGVVFDFRLRRGSGDEQ